MVKRDNRHIGAGIGFVIAAVVIAVARQAASTARPGDRSGEMMPEPADSSGFLFGPPSPVGACELRRSRKSTRPRNVVHHRGHCDLREDASILNRFARNRNGEDRRVHCATRFIEVGVTHFRHAEE